MAKTQRKVRIPTRPDGKPISHVDMPACGDYEAWGHHARADRLCRELRRDWTLEQLGPVVSIKDAMERLGCS